MKSGSSNPFAWRMRVARCAVSVAALAAATSASAQEPYWLDAVTVVALKVEELGIESLTAVSTIRQEQTDLIQPDKISDMFYNVPGVAFNQSADDPATAINIRGLQDFGRVAVVIDGARQNFQRSGHNANGMFYADPELISDADIVRGPVANIYGSGAIGGVASFRTKEAGDILRPGEKWGVQTHGLSGTNSGRWLGSAFFSGRPSDNVDFIFGGAYRANDDYKDGRGNTVVNSGRDIASGLAKLTFRPTDGAEVKLGGVLYEAKYDSGQPLVSGIYGKVTANHTLTGRYTFHRPETPLIDFMANVYWNKTKAEQTVKSELAFDISTNPAPVCFTPGVGTCVSFTGPVGASRSFAVDTKGFDVNNTSRFDVGPFQHALTLGGDYFKDDVTTISVNEPGSVLTPSGVRSVGGAFAQLKTNYANWLEIISGVRYDTYALDGAGLSRSGSRLSPKITVGVTPRDGFTVYGTYAEGYRSPAVTETLISGYHPGNIFWFDPNPNLRPEIGKTLEAGINLKYDNVWTAGDRFRAKANVFRNNVTDFIDLQTSGPFFPPSSLPCPPSASLMGAGAFCAQYVNIANARIQGVELESHYDAGVWLGGVSYTYLDGKDRNTGARLASVPPQHASAYIGARFLDRKLTALLRWQYFGGTGENPSTQLPHSSYHLFGLVFAYEFKPDVVATLVVDNLFDTYYIPYLNDLPSPGLTVKGSLKFRFGDGLASVASGQQLR